MSTWAREWLGWLHYERIRMPNELWIESIDTNRLGGAAYRLDLPSSAGQDKYYILEARVRDGRHNNRYDKDPRKIDKETQTLNLYEVTDQTTIAFTGKWREPVINIPRECAFGLGVPPCVNEGILNRDGEEFKDHANRIKFKRTGTIDTPPTTFQAQVAITPLETVDYSAPLKGLFLVTTRLPDVADNAAFILEGTAPDLDLHVYTDDGKHVGMNYDTGFYEVGIPGTLASGDMLGSTEWILLPLGLTGYHYVVSPRDVQEYLNAHPEISPSTAVSDYEVYATVIDPASPVFFDSAHVAGSVLPGVYVEHGLTVVPAADGTYAVRAGAGVEITATDPDLDGYLSGQEFPAGANPYFRESFPGVVTLNLRPGFNLVSLPVQVTSMPTAHMLLAYLGDATAIDRIRSHDPVTGTSREVFYDAVGNPAGTDFALTGGEALIVYAKIAKNVTFRSIYCYPWDLKIGINLVGSACTSTTAFPLLGAIGNDAAVSSIQRFNPYTGRFETAGYNQTGQPVGVDFPIMAGEGYIVSMRGSRSGFVP